MKCREYENQVQSFLKDEMSDEMMREFMEHVQGCARCYEELEIYHSVYDGLELMKHKEAIPPIQESADTRLRHLLEERKRRIAVNRIKRIARILVFATCIAGILTVGGCSIVKAFSSPQEDRAEADYIETEGK